MDIFFTIFVIATFYCLCSGMYNAYIGTRIWYFNQYTSLLYKLQSPVKKNKVCGDYYFRVANRVYYLYGLTCPVLS